MDFAKELPESCFSGFVLNGSTLNILVTDCEPHNHRLPLKKLAAVVDTWYSGRKRKLEVMLHNYYGADKPLYFRNSSAGFFNSYNEVTGFINEIFEKIISTPGMIYQVNTMGGKIKDLEFEKGSCYPHRAFDFLAELQAYWDAPSQEKKIADVTTAILNTTRQQGIIHQYVNYCSLEFSDWENAYYQQNYERLQAIKRRYDPDNNVRHPQSIRI